MQVKTQTTAPRTPATPAMDAAELAHLSKPEEHGWRRELVKRKVISANRTGDVYYYPPKGR